MEGDGARRGSGCHPRVDPALLLDYPAQVCTMVQHLANMDFFLKWLRYHQTKMLTQIALVVSILICIVIS